MTAPSWPEPTDGLTARARKIAIAYRQLILDHLDTGDANTKLREALTELDTRMRGYGQYWVTGTAEAFDDDEWVPADIGGDIVGLSSSRLSHLRIAGALEGKRMGRAFYYRVGDLRAYRGKTREGQIEAKLLARLHGGNTPQAGALPPDDAGSTVNANGTSAS